MHAVILTGHGGIDKLVYKTNVEVPLPKPDEVLVSVKGAGINNTDINTRIGWYSKSVTSNTNDGGANGLSALHSGASQPHGEAVPVVVAAGLVDALTGGRTLLHFF